jgi:uncharacterized protein
MRIDRTPAVCFRSSKARITTPPPETPPLCTIFARPFLSGSDRAHTLDIETYIREQGAREYCAMNLAWAQLRRLFENDPWGEQGPQGPKARMAFMATYNIDLFRDFVFNSSYLKRYKVASALVKKLRTDDAALLLFGFEWVKVFVWGLRSRQLQPR